VQQSEERPSLYLLAVGVSRYRDKALNLKYAAADAADVAEALQQRGQGLFQSIQIQFLQNQNATLDNITQAFQELAGQVKPTDVFVLFLAGHGTVLEDGNYYFIPWDMVYENTAALRDRGLSKNRLQELLARIPARKSLILIDTCNAGGTVPALAMRSLVDKNAIDRLMRATGRALLAASSDTQMAIEGYKGHGVFTYALLQGLQGQAPDYNRNNTIEIDELAAFVVDEVPRIALRRWHQEQFPMRDLQGMSFPIGVHP
jgi:uncharacterized caspase-like protein